MGWILSTTDNMQLFYNNLGHTECMFIVCEIIPKRENIKWFQKIAFEVHNDF